MPGNHTKKENFMEEKKWKVNTVKDWLQILAIVVAATWAIWKFIYQDRILPEKLPPHLVMTSEMEIIGVENSMTAVRVKVDIHNSSKRKIAVLSSWYHIAGSRIDSYELENTEFSAALKRNMNDRNIIKRTPRYFYDIDFMIIEAGKLLDESWWFEADEKFTKSFIVFVPANKYDLIKLRADVNVAKNIEPFVDRWEVDEDCSVYPVTYLKLEGFESDTSRVERYDPLAKHKDIQSKYHLVHTNTASELSLWK
jgi:hypothetical protein